MSEWTVVEDEEIEVGGMGEIGFEETGSGSCWGWVVIIVEWDVEIIVDDDVGEEAEIAEVFSKEMGGDVPYVRQLVSIQRAQEEFVWH